MKAETAGLIAVIDTNVWISSFLSKTGTPALLTRQLISRGRPVFTATTFAELRERLWRPKFDRYLRLEQRKRLLRDVDAVAPWTTVPPDMEQQRFSRDVDDDKFIQAALASQAPYLISGDQDLLVLADAMQAQGVAILSPADALRPPCFQPTA